MKRQPFSSLITLIFFCSAFLCSAQNYPRCSDYTTPTINPTGSTYYVAATGNDTNPGTEALPWKTIQKAAATMLPGDITYIKAGTYYETNIQFTNSGTQSSPIVLSAYASAGVFDSVIIDGSSAGSKYDLGIWLDSISHVFFQGLIIQNMPYVGLAANHGENIIIRNVIIRNNGDSTISLPYNGAGLLLQAINGFVIDSVTAYNNVGDGISVLGEGINVYVENGFIINSKSYSNDDFQTPANSDAHGIAINQGRFIAVCNCEVWGNRDHGFDVSDWPKGDSVSHHVTYENNISHNNYNPGFSANSSSHHILYLRNLSYENLEGFYGYSEVGHLEYYHNVALRNKEAAFWTDKPDTVFAGVPDYTITLKNNIVYNNDTTNWDTPPLVVMDNKYGLTVENNNFYKASGLSYAAFIEPLFYTSSQGGLDSLGLGNVPKHPEFVDGDNAIPDIHLQAISEMIDAGTAIYINGIAEPFNGSGPDLGVYEYDNPVFIDENFNKELSFQIFPNPFSDYLRITNLSEYTNYELKIFDVLGKIVFQKTLNSKLETLNLDLPSGMYFLQIKNDNFIQTKKLKVIR